MDSGQGYTTVFARFLCRETIVCKGELEGDRRLNSCPGVGAELWAGADRDEGW